MNLLTNAELEEARYNLEQARASLACEGLFLTKEEEALFSSFEAQRLPHDECIRQLLEFNRARYQTKGPTRP